MVITYYIVPSCSMCSGVLMEVKFTTMVLFNAVGDIFTSFVLVWVIIKLARVGWYMPSIGQFWVPFFKKFTEWDSFLCNHFNIFFVDGDKLLDNVCYRYRLRPSSLMNHFGSTWWLCWSASWMFPMLVFV